MTKVNFHIYYEIDKDEVKLVLRADECDGDGEGSWVLLERPWVGRKAQPPGRLSCELRRQST